MPNTMNVHRLQDNTIEPYVKLKASVYLKKETFSKAESLITLSESQSRNDVFEKAIDFYFGYITSQLSQEFLCGVFGNKIDGLIGTLGTRIARGNFRNAVEMDMHTRMLASAINLSAPEYERLRKKSVGEVKRLNGSINILDAVNEPEEEQD